MRVFGFAILLALNALIATSCDARPLRFVVFGDLQDGSAEGRARDRALIARINSLEPAFSVFTGDIKGGGPGCPDALYDEMRNIFDGHQGPLIYTPGDNEWTDCRPDPIGRKKAVIERFTAEGQSLGREPMRLTQQGGQRENARWAAAGVVFATLHITGSNNNLRQDEAAVAEHMARDAANGEWLTEAFAHAEAQDALGVVLFIHGNPKWQEPAWSPTGFDRFRALLASRAQRFGRAVLVVHGDTHTFRIDKPLGPAVNVTRLEVFGPPHRGAVVVSVDPGFPEVFAFSIMQLD